MQLICCAVAEVCHCHAWSAPDAPIASFGLHQPTLPRLHSVDQFAQRAGAAHVCLLYEAASVSYPVGVPDPLTGALGYQVPPDADPCLAACMAPSDAVDLQPDIAFEPPQGLRSFPAVFSYPIVALQRACLKCVCVWRISFNGISQFILYSDLSFIFT